MKANNENILIKPCEDADLDLLFQLNTSEMTQHLGGPESEEQILQRYKRYLNLGEKGRIFRYIKENP